MYAHRLGRAGAIVALCALAACGTEPSALQLDIALDKNVVDVSDSVQVTLTLRNASEHPVQVLAADAYGACLHAFQVFDAAGHQVTPQIAFCALAASLIAPRRVELGPLESMTIRQWWVPGQSSVNGAPLTTGLYHLRGATDGVYSASKLVEVLDGPTIQ